MDHSRQIITAAMKVHTALGPGLLERAYEECLCFELRSRGLLVERQVELPVVYSGQRMDVSYRIDLLVEQSTVVEVKAVAALHSIHEAQLLSYLRLSDLKLGILLNFHVLHMREGVKRMVNQF